MKTWHVERAVAVTIAVILAVVFGRSSIQPWLIAAARISAFAPLSISDRIAERATLRLRWADAAGVPANVHEVECAKQAARAVVVAVVIAAAAQAYACAWDGVIWAALCAAYRPVWRRAYRSRHPLPAESGDLSSGRDARAFVRGAPGSPFRAGEAGGTESRGAEH